MRCRSYFEQSARKLGLAVIAGIDEVGRGCLFGAVFAGAVVLDPARPIRHLRDSKLLLEPERSELAQQIRHDSLAWAVGAADAFEIDQVNILQATRLAMQRAVHKLTLTPDCLLIDALTLPLPIAQLAIIGGDLRCRSIAAASILAKVERDTSMMKWDEVFPGYNLRSNKGYSTPCHRAALRALGPTALHRFSFQPVRDCCPTALWTEYRERLTETLQDAARDATA